MAYGWKGHLRAGGQHQLIGVLHYLRIISRFCNAAKMPLMRKKLTHRGTHHRSKLRKTGLAIFLRKPVENRSKFKNKYIDVIIFDGDIAPTTSFKPQVTQHLPRCKGYIPSIVPGKGEIGSFLSQSSIMLPFGSFGNQCQIIGSSRSIKRSLLILTVCIQCRRKVI